MPTIASSKPKSTNNSVKLGTRQFYQTLKSVLFDPEIPLNLLR